MQLKVLENLDFHPNLFWFWALCCGILSFSSRFENPADSSAWPIVVKSGFCKILKAAATFHKSWINFSKSFWAFLLFRELPLLFIPLPLHHPHLPPKILFLLSYFCLLFSFFFASHSFPHPFPPSRELEEGKVIAQTPLRCLCYNFRFYVGMFIIRFGIFITIIKTIIWYRSIQMRCIRNLIRPCCFSPPWTKRPPGWKNKGLTKNKGSPDFLKHFSLPGSVSRVHTLLYFSKQMQQKLVLASWCNATAGP